MPKNPNARAKRIMVRLTPELHAKVERLASADHRTVANWAAYVIEEAVARAERRAKPKP